MVIITPMVPKQLEAQHGHTPPRCFTNLRLEPRSHNLPRRNVDMRSFHGSLKTPSLRSTRKITLLIAFGLRCVCHSEMWALELGNRASQRAAKRMNTSDHRQNVILLKEVVGTEEREFLYAPSAAHLEEMTNIFTFLERHARAVDLRDRPWLNAVDELAKHLTRAQRPQEIGAQV